MPRLKQTVRWCVSPRVTATPQPLGRWIIRNVTSLTLKGDQHPAQLTAEFVALSAAEPSPRAVDVLLMQNVQNVVVKE